MLAIFLSYDIAMLTCREHDKVHRKDSSLVPSKCTMAGFMLIIDVEQIGDSSHSSFLEHTLVVRILQRQF